MKCKLKDFCTVINGRAYSQKELLDKGKYRVLRVGNFFSSDRWYFSDLELSAEKYCNKGDLLFAWACSFGPRIWDGEDRTIFHYHIWKLDIDSAIVDKKYLYYLLKISVDSMTAGTHGSVMMHITKSDMENFEFDIPTLEVQKKIAAILSALDEKIAINRAINDNLLEQMQAIYKSWFVDYLPFGGVMPESWTKTGIYSLANIIYGAPFASKQFNTEGNGKPIIRIRDLKDQHFATYTTEVHPKGYLLRPGDIVVGMDGEFRPYIWGNDEAWLNQRVCVFENKRPKGKAFLYFTIKPLLYAIEQTQVATTVIHIGKKDYDAFEIMLPDAATLDSFDSLTAPMIMRVVSNSFENKRLAVMRDALLPRLMSGEIDVSAVKL